jgi:Zn-dependent peptidase ImmA (M78 family)
MVTDISEKPLRFQLQRCYSEPMPGPSLQGLLNPTMLRWAREQSRMDLDIAAKKVGQKPQRLQEWEHGERCPTLTQLRKLASTYKRSVGVFFLREIPIVPRRPTDYRRMELRSSGMLNPRVADGIRECEAKRDAALDIYAELETQPADWTLNLDTGLSPEAAAIQITNVLGITMDVRRSWHSEYEALNGWKSALEARGVLVFQLSGVDVREMRGCSISLRPLPIVVLNSSDTPLGRIFTLLHEITHIARGESTLCDLVDEDHNTTSERVEQYCNHVAGAMLVPPDELARLDDVERANGSTEWSDERLSELRRFFWASRETVLRRLLIHGRTSLVFYRQKREQLERDFREMKATQTSTPIIPFYRKVILSNGRALTRLAVSAYNAQAITGTELSRILNTKLDHLPAIRNALQREVIA